MNTVKANGTDFTCEVRGTGEPLVLVHGALGDFRTWRTQMATFTRNYRVLAYSRRWHYPSLAVVQGEDYTPDAQLADLLAILEVIGPAHLVGHSYGAAIAAAAALHRPELVHSLVLAEPSLFSLLTANGAGASALAHAVAAIAPVVPLLRQGRKADALRHYLDVILGAGGYERLPVRARIVMHDNLHTLEPMLNGLNAGTPFTQDHAARISVPTLLLEGEQTPAPFALTLDELAGAIPDVQRVVLPGLSHGLHLENPTAFNRAVADFLAGVQAAALAA